MSPEQTMNEMGVRNVPSTFAANDRESVPHDVPPPDRGASLPLVWFDEIEPVTDVTDFVQGVLTEKSAAVVYGDSNAGKTFWVTNLALHVAAGIQWNGRRVEQGGVVYAVLEGGNGFKNRIAAWRKDRGFDRERIPFAAIPVSLNLLNAEVGHVDALISTVKAAAEQMSAPLKVVVIDTLSRAMSGGNENSPEDMGALVANMDRIRAETGACVLFVHHSGKDQARGARGHSLLRAALDTEIEVVTTEGGEARTAEVVKQRDLKKGDVFGFNLNVVQVGTNRHGEDVTSCVVEDVEANKAAGKRKKLSGHMGRAYEVLRNTIAAEGATGHIGVPDRISSVPEQAWRDRFYTSSMPGDEQAAKQKAFRRAVKDLFDRSLTGMSGGRVWLTDREQPGQDVRT